jgi:general secretion pathway protein G
MNRVSRGFTLIELLVVIAIIGILSSVVLASLNSARVKGRDARRISDLKQLQLALELYYDTNQTYPAGSGAASTTLTALTGASSPYISVIPSDPTNTAQYVYSYASAVAGSGAACASVPCSSYVIKAVLEGGDSAVPAGDVDGNWGGLGATACDDPSYCVKP